MNKTILYFRAEWCGPCRTMAKVFDALCGDYPDVAFRKVDVDEEPELTARHKVRAVPTMILLEDGKEVNRIAGSRPAREAAKALGL